jgi:hypothetical protein
MTEIKVGGNGYGRMPLRYVCYRSAFIHHNERQPSKRGAHTEPPENRIETPTPIILQVAPTMTAEDGRAASQ